MQKHWVAIATAVMLLCVGFLTRHHEAETAHAREASGAVVHATALADRHVHGANAHLHETAAHGHAGECTLLGLAHVPLLDTEPVRSTAGAAQTVVIVDVLVTTASRQLDALRLAPKTSPPTDRHT